MERRTKVSKLTVERLREVFEYDPVTGILTNKIHRGMATKGHEAGTMHPEGYRLVIVDMIQARTHRIAWAIMTGAWPENEVDHRNRIRDDNRWENLREATDEEQARNQTLYSNNKSGIRGVNWSRQSNAWVAGIRVSKKRIHLGVFANIEDAAAVRLVAEKRYFGDYAPS